MARFGEYPQSRDGYADDIDGNDYVKQADFAHLPKKGQICGTPGNRAFAAFGVDR